MGATRAASILFQPASVQTRACWAAGTASPVPLLQCSLAGWAGARLCINRFQDGTGEGDNACGCLQLRKWEKKHIRLQRGKNSAESHKEGKEKHQDRRRLGCSGAQVVGWSSHRHQMPGGRGGTWNSRERLGEFRCMDLVLPPASSAVCQGQAVLCTRYSRAAGEIFPTIPSWEPSCSHQGSTLGIPAP